MTSEERAKALQEMQASAKARTREVDTRKRGGHDDDEDDDDAKVRGNASFLQDMREQTHGLKGANKTMASRMAENRNTQQRLHDDSFL
jgi:hypothetical protein